MDRLNHVKIVTPEPEAVDRFLREVLDLPEGWPMPSSNAPPEYPPLAAREVTWDNVMTLRGDDDSGGCITGTTESGQFQIMRGPKAHIWSVAVGTRHIERAHQRCIERGSDALPLALDAGRRGGARG